MKTVFVTGADRGLGLGFIKVLLDKGYKVIAGHHSSAGEELLNLKAQNAAMSLVRLDIASDESVQTAAQAIRNQTESIDLLINNAGVLGDIEKTIMDSLNFEEILQVMNINSLGPLRVINALIDLILKSDTKIIANISSEAGSIGQNQREGWFGYCMSKAALNMGGSIIHKNILKQGGRVMQIHPGWVKSYMHGYKNDAAHFEPEEAAAKILEVIEQQTETPLPDAPIYIDLHGNKLEW